MIQAASGPRRSERRCARRKIVPAATPLPLSLYSRLLHFWTWSAQDLDGLLELTDRIVSVT
jgi:hypothetical protein